MSAGIDRWVRDIRNQRQLQELSVPSLKLPKLEARAPGPSAVSAPGRRHRASHHPELVAGRVQLVTLTVADLDATTAGGAMRKLHDDLRHLPGRSSELQYFWWAEFQRRGAIHFHAIWLDSPFRTNREVKSWLKRHWPHARLWPVVKSRSTEWFTARAGAYVGNYAKKMGTKRYQQRYDLMPKGWHVFASSRLAWSVTVHRQHEHRPVIELWCRADLPWATRQDWYFVVARDWHLPPPGGCRLPAGLRRKTVTPRHTPPGRGRRLRGAPRAFGNVDKFGAPRPPDPTPIPRGGGSAAEGRGCHSNPQPQAADRLARLPYDQSRQALAGTSGTTQRESLEGSRHAVVPQG